MLRQPANTYTPMSSSVGKQEKCLHILWHQLWADQAYFPITPRLRVSDKVSLLRVIVYRVSSQLQYESSFITQNSWPLNFLLFNTGLIKIWLMNKSVDCGWGECYNLRQILIERSINYYSIVYNINLHGLNQKRVAKLYHYFWNKTIYLYVFHTVEEATQLKDYFEILNVSHNSH